MAAKMRRKIRRSAVTRDELIADAVFLAVSALISFAAVLLFDVHHSFYSWPFRLELIFTTPFPYLLFVPTGTIAIFLVIKALLFGFEEEEKARR
ncbi:MAG: hypothetical protein QXU82_01375 [Candidatus Aenigmatarchaeota archaeon]